MVSGPEMARITRAFQSSLQNPAEGNNFRHHEQSKNAQMKFAHDVISLTETIEKMRSAFTDISCDLLKLDNRAIMDTLITLP